MSTSLSPTVRPRADAQRNRRLLLEAAAVVFSERGIDAPAIEVARRAGVAKGTLFRHFPTKRDLVSAVLIDRITQIRALTDEIATRRPAGLAAVAELMTSAAAVVAADRSFFDAATVHVAADVELQREKQAFEASLDELVASAQNSGEVRTDIRGVDLAMLIMAATNTCAPSQDAYPELWRRYLTLMIDGLRPGPVSALPQPAVPILAASPPAR